MIDYLTRKKAELDKIAQVQAARQVDEEEKTVPDPELPPWFYRAGLGRGTT